MKFKFLINIFFITGYIFPVVTTLQEQFLPSDLIENIILDSNLVENISEKQARMFAHVCKRFYTLLRIRFFNQFWNELLEKQFQLYMLEFLALKIELKFKDTEPIDKLKILKDINLYKKSFNLFIGKNLTIEKSLITRISQKCLLKKLKSSQLTPKDYLVQILEKFEQLINYSIFYSTISVKNRHEFEQIISNPAFSESILQCRSLSVYFGERNYAKTENLLPRYSNLTSLSMCMKTQNHIPSIFLTTKLTDLKICTLEDSGFSLPQALTKLKYLSFLESLTISNAVCGQRNYISDMLTDLTKLTMLSLVSTKARHIGPEINRLSRLTELDLRNNKQIINITHPIILNYLTNLDISNCSIYSFGNSLKNLINLLILKTKNNKLSYLSPEMLPTTLKKLYLKHNKIDYIPNSITSLTNLTTLSLGQNPITKLELPYYLLLIACLKTK